MEDPSSGLDEDQKETHGTVNAAPDSHKTNSAAQTRMFDEELHGEHTKAAELISH